MCRLGMTFLRFLLSTEELTSNEYFGLSTQVHSRQIGLNQLMTQAVNRRLKSIQLTTQADSPGIDSGRLMARVSSLGI